MHIFLDFFTERRLTIQLNDGIMCRYTGRGLAQGDPILQLLFNQATLHVSRYIKNVICPNTQTILPYIRLV